MAAPNITASAASAVQQPSATSHRGWSEVLKCLQMGELEMHPETPRTPMQKAVNSITTYLRATLAPAKRGERGAQGAPPAGSSSPAGEPPAHPGGEPAVAAQPADGRCSRAKPGSAGFLPPGVSCEAISEINGRGHCCATGRLECPPAVIVISSPVLCISRVG